MRVLVTAGGTSEPVDGVRRLTNTSTGRTGAIIAREFIDAGAEVLLLHAAGSSLPGVTVHTETFVSFEDLEKALKRHLSGTQWDAVIHLAAVSDYSVASVEIDGEPANGVGKISSGREVVIRLRPNPKLIDGLARWSRNPDVRVVGFKLTNEPDPVSCLDQVSALLDRGAADFVVHNDLSEINGDRHLATIHDRRGVVARTETKEQLARELWRLLANGVKE
jgi:phosphopantothenoylcysteine decarboxylase/phosphopantothenate--cysteine ligase